MSDSDLRYAAYNEANTTDRNVAITPATGDNEPSENNNVGNFAIIATVRYIEYYISQKGIIMFKKIKSYLKFWSKKLPSYKMGSSYGGFKMNIDEYYALDENRKKLQKINNSTFPDIIKKKDKENVNDRDSSVQPG